MQADIVIGKLRQIFLFTDEELLANEQAAEGDAPQPAWQRLTSRKADKTQVRSFPSSSSALCSPACCRTSTAQLATSCFRDCGDDIRQNHAHGGAANHSQWCGKRDRHSSTAVEN